jgi:hypothetical protein
MAAGKRVGNPKYQRGRTHAEKGPYLAHSFGGCVPAVKTRQAVKPDEGDAAMIWAIWHTFFDAPELCRETVVSSNLTRVRSCPRS